MSVTTYPWVGAARGDAAPRKWAGAVRPQAFLTGQVVKRKAIKYATGGIPASDLSGFPKLFKIVADSDIAAELGSGGGITITKADGTTEVPFGFYPSNNLATGDLLLRAKFDLSHTAAAGDVLGYLYYDARIKSPEDKQGAVSNGYVLFCPMEQDPSGPAPQLLDWVTNRYTGTTAGSMTSGELVSAQVGNGLSLDGINDGVSFTGVFNAAMSAMTAESWCYPTSITGYLTLFDTATRMLSLFVGSGTFYGIGGANTGYSMTHPWTINAWQHAALRWNGSTGDVLRNGVVENSGLTGVNPTVDTTHPLTVGLNPSTGGTLYPGKVDEVRISNVARTDDWLAYAITDDSNNSSTFTLGSEESNPFGGGGNTVTPSVVAATSSVLGVSVLLSNGPGTVQTTDSVLAPTVGRVVQVSTVMATAAALIPLTVLINVPGVVQVTDTVLQPSPSVTAPAQVVTATAGVNTPASLLNNQPVTVTVTDSVLAPTSQLLNQPGVVQVTDSVLGPTVSVDGGIIAAAVTVTAAASVMPPATSLTTSPVELQVVVSPLVPGQVLRVQLPEVQTADSVLAPALATVNVPVVVQVSDSVLAPQVNVVQQAGILQTTSSVLPPTVANAFTVTPATVQATVLVNPPAALLASLPGYVSVVASVLVPAVIGAVPSGDAGIVYAMITLTPEVFVGTITLTPEVAVAVQLTPGGS